MLARSNTFVWVCKSQSKIKSAQLHTVRAEERSLQQRAKRKGESLSSEISMLHRDSKENFDLQSAFSSSHPQ